MVVLCSWSWVWQDKNFDTLTQPFPLGMSGIQGVMCLGGDIPCPRISGSCRLAQLNLHEFSTSLCWLSFYIMSVREKMLTPSKFATEIRIKFYHFSLCSFVCKCWMLCLLKEKKKFIMWFFFPKLLNVFCALAMVFCHLLTAGFRVFQGWAWSVTSAQDSLQLQYVCTALSWTEKVLQQLINHDVDPKGFLYCYS